jgi:ribonucleotide monophosphatase NagD (HAD superfamily)
VADGLPNGSAAGLRAFAATCDVVLCDVFGTLHESELVFPGTAEALPLFREIGGVVVLVSNSVHSGARLAESLTERGVPRSSYDAVITSADGTRSALHERVVAAVHHLGPAADRALFDGLDISLAPVDEANLVVCTGYPEEDFAAALFRAFERGLNLVCTSRHRDQDRPLAPSIRRAGRGALPRSGRPFRRDRKARGRDLRVRRRARGWPVGPSVRTYEGPWPRRQPRA